MMTGLQFFYSLYTAQKKKKNSFSRSPYEAY